MLSEAKHLCLFSVGVQMSSEILRFAQNDSVTALERFIVARCIAFLGVVLCAVPVQTLRADPSKTILVFGDSLSDGFMLKRSEAYPALLGKKLRATGLNFQVINASAAGGTTEGGLERLPPHLKHRIDVFILELGINDAFRGLSIDQIQSNLQQIMDKVKTRNPTVRVVIAGMQLPNYAGDDYVLAFGKMFSDLAARNNAALVPYLLQGVAGDPSLNLPDGIHPNAAGQRILAEIATEGENHHQAVQKLRGPLMKIKGVKDVKVDLKHERVIVTFDARRTHPPDLHDAILNSGYRPGPVARE